MKTTLEPRRLTAEHRAIYSSCCGVTGENVLTDSSVVMLYAGLLGAGGALKIITTALFPFLSGLLMIPMAFLAMRWGCRRQTVGMSLVAGVAALAVPLAIYCGPAKVAILLGLLILFSSALSGFVSGWFPLLDTFLLPERSTGFIGRMRFCHQATSVVFLTIAGWLVGTSPAPWQLQLVILASAIIFLGRAFWLSRIPVFPAEKTDASGWKGGFSLAIHNRQLLKAACYVFLLYLASYGTIPLWTLFLESQGTPDNQLIYISAAALSGMMLGYLAAGKLPTGKLTSALKILQACLIALGVLLFFLPARWIVVTGCTLATYNFLIALVSVAATGLMFATAVPGNKTMSMAVFGTLSNLGMGCSRLFAAAILKLENNPPVLLGHPMEIFHLALLAGLLILLLAFLLNTRTTAKTPPDSRHSN